MLIILFINFQAFKNIEAWLGLGRHAIPINLKIFNNLDTSFCYRGFVSACLPNIIYIIN